jgi:hypothetical protein
MLLAKSQADLAAFKIYDCLFFEKKDLSYGDTCLGC